MGTVELATAAGRTVSTSSGALLAQIVGELHVPVGPESRRRSRGIRSWAPSAVALQKSPLGAPRQGKLQHIGLHHRARWRGR